MADDSKKLTIARTLEEATSPRVLGTVDILQRWESAVQHYWDETSGECSECLGTFRTGDVNHFFGDFDNALVKRFYLCTPCGYKAILAGNYPAATMIFIENEHRGLRLDVLPKPVLERLDEAFQIVDRIHAGVGVVVDRANAEALRRLQEKAELEKGEPN